MAVLFDPTDAYVRSVLDLAKVHGEITLAELESIVEAAIEAKGHFDTEDIADTVDALAALGIEIDDGLTQEQKDAEFDRAMTDWVGQGNLLPSLTAEGWAMLGRVMAREKAAESSPPDPAKPSLAEDAAAAR